MSSYYDRLLPVLSAQPQTLDALMTAMALPSNKLTYVIGALQKAIDEGKCRRIDTPGEKRKFLGHKFATVAIAEEKKE